MSCLERGNVTSDLFRTIGFAAMAKARSKVVSKVEESIAVRTEKGAEVTKIQTCIYST